MTGRSAEPWMVHLIWDAIENCSAQRQQPNFERVSKFIMRSNELSPEEIEQELNRVVEDGLVRHVQRLGNKGAKKGEEQELYKLPNEDPERGEHDWYCGVCHRPGELRGCTACSSAYHATCLPAADGDADALVCPMCQALQAEKCDMKKERLNTLLTYTCNRLRARMLPLSVNEGILSPSSDEDLKFRSDQLLHEGLEIDDVEKKLKKQQYKKLAEFETDINRVVHNVILMNGPESDAAAIMALVSQDCAYDLQQIRICRHCYRMSNEKRGKSWFCRPCNPPHQLVFARQKGYPYWPAKVMEIGSDNVYDVRFFGEPHERANVPSNQIKPIDTNLGSMQIKRSAPWNRAYDELKKHQANLRDAAKNPALLESDAEELLISDAEEAPAQVEVTPTPRKRGRPKGSTNKSTTHTPTAKRRKRTEPESDDTEEEKPVQKTTTPRRRKRVFDSEEDGLVEVKENTVPATKSNNEKNGELPSRDDQVSSSCQDPQPRTVAVQTPAKLLRAAAAEQASANGGGGGDAEEKVRALEKELERLKQTHKQEVAALTTQHAQMISATKRRQWCFNCEQEAIYHCCWNTAYCSTECQQSHWHKEHKRVCRRKRTA